MAAVVSICRFATVRSQAGLVMKAASLSFVGRPRAVHRTSSSGPAVRAKLRTSALSWRVHLDHEVAWPDPHGKGKVQRPGSEGPRIAEEMLFAGRPRCSASCMRGIVPKGV